MTAPPARVRPFACRPQPVWAASTNSLLALTSVSHTDLIKHTSQRARGARGASLLLGEDANPGASEILLSGDVLMA